MRRADRLFEILQLLRRRRVATAQQIAETLEVSVRTIYRDVQDLVASGVPIEGEAGVGYALAKGFDLPPLMFGESEIEALVLGARMVESWGDEKLAEHARKALARIEAALPDRLRARTRNVALFAPSFHVPEAMREKIASLRAAVASRRRVEIAYVDRAKAPTSRVVRPLGLFYWGSGWTLGAWCELRDGFRNFRLDRVERLQVRDEVFPDEPERGLDAFLAAMQAETRAGGAS